jgi:hypothetical protein
VPLAVVGGACMTGSDSEGKISSRWRETNEIANGGRCRVTYYSNTCLNRQSGMTLERNFNSTLQPKTDGGNSDD